MNIPNTLLKRLDERAKNHSLRELSTDFFPIDFWSNDYLGFSQLAEIEKITQEILTQFPIQNGATGSRLISGNHKLYQQAERLISDFHKVQSCLIFNSGYDANIGIFSSIPQKGDLILYDQYIHASIRDGISLSYAKSLKFKHNDLENLEKLLQKFQPQSQNIYIATESVFSMDGDSPDLQKLVVLSEKYQAYLIVDEAHSLGVFGRKGEGLVQKLNLENSVFIRLVTFGKGLGCHGAAVLACEKVISYLVNFARSFIYTTGLSPHSVASIMAGYQCLTMNNQQELLHKNIRFFQQKIKEFGLENRFIKSDSPIQVLLQFGNEAVKNIAQQLQEHGFGIKPILSPTVPKGEERLRICLHSFNTENQIDTLFQILQKYT